MQQLWRLVEAASLVVADWYSAATRPLVLEEPASLALFCTGLAPDLGPAPEVMPACCAAFTGVALKRAWDPAGHTSALSSLISGLPDLAAVLGPQAAAEQLLAPVLALLPHRLPDLGPALVPVLAPLLALLPAEAHLDLQASWAHIARQEHNEDQPELLAAAHGIAGQGPGGKDPDGLCEQLLAMALGSLLPPPPPGRSPGSQTPSGDEAVLPAQSAGLQHTASNSHALLTLLGVCQGYATSACLVLPGRCEGFQVQFLGTALGQAAAAHPSQRSCHRAGARGLQQWQAVSPQCEGAAQVAAAGCELQQHLAQGDMALAQASAARAARALARAVTPAL
ncbi:hypothetical protein QJQ45_000100 [Haematococcus lacustris]|nr:hypothetical protein QJQ45_000100 [Haematococcus lacustris]